MDSKKRKDQGSQKWQKDYIHLFGMYHYLHNQIHRWRPFCADMAHHSKFHSFLCKFLHNFHLFFHWVPHYPIWCNCCIDPPDLPSAIDLHCFYHCTHAMLFVNSCEKSISSQSTVSTQSNVVLHGSRIILINPQIRYGKEFKV